MSNKSNALKEHIVSLSAANTFKDAKEEWKWVGVSYVEDWDTCPCSQRIKEVCHIYNKKNGNETHVGNNCINKFLGVDTGNVFFLLKKLIENHDWTIPLKLIGYASKLGYLHYSEVDFLTGLTKYRKHPLSEKQKAWRDKIVWRILNKVQVKE